MADIGIHGVKKIFIQADVELGNLKLEIVSQLPGQEAKSEEVILFGGASAQIEWLAPVGKNWEPGQPYASFDASDYVYALNNKEAA